MKKLVSLAMMLCLLLSLALPAWADGTEKGSIEIKVEYKGTKISGGQLIAVRVGYLDEEKAIFRRVTTRSEIKNIGDSAAVTQMQNFYSANKNTHGDKFKVYKAEVKDGAAKFADVELGLYLVYQDTPASGYDKLSAFLVTVPYQGSRDVTSAAKTALVRAADPSGGSGSSSSSSGSKLPQTGQLTWPIPWMTLGGMVLFVFGWWLCFGKRKDSL